MTDLPLWASGDDDAVHRLTRRIDQRPQADDSLDSGTRRPARQDEGPVLAMQEARYDRGTCSVARGQRHAGSVDRDRIASGRGGRRLPVPLDGEVTRRAGRLCARLPGGENDAKNDADADAAAEDCQPTCAGWSRPGRTATSPRVRGRMSLDHLRCPFGSRSSPEGIACPDRPEPAIARGVSAGTMPLLRPHKYLKRLAKLPEGM